MPRFVNNGHPPPPPPPSTTRLPHLAAPAGPADRSCADPYEEEATINGQGRCQSLALFSEPAAYALWLQHHHHQVRAKGGSSQEFIIIIFIFFFGGFLRPEIPCRGLEMPLHGAETKHTTKKKKNIAQSQ